MRLFPRILIGLGVLFALAAVELFTGKLLLFTGALHLLTGWATFLPQRLPKATVNWSGVGMLLVCGALAAGFAHNFCGWLWRGTGHEGRWQPRWTGAGLAVLLLLFVSGMAVTGMAHQIGWLITSPDPLVSSGFGNDRIASTSLKTICSVQADFRGNDRDNNKVFDYWRADIAGLYTTEVEGIAIKLIELSVAAADDRPKGNIEKYGDRSPRAGYWFRALLHQDEKEPDPQRFAACSFPNSRSAGRYMFIVCEDNILWRKPFEGTPPDVYPKDPLAEGWSKLD